MNSAYDKNVSADGYYCGPDEEYDPMTGNISPAVRRIQAGANAAHALAKTPPKTSVKIPEFAPKAATRDERKNRKIRTDFLSPVAMLALAEHMTHAGGGRYLPWDWQDNMTTDEAVAACMRHLFKWQAGEDFDPADAAVGYKPSHLLAAFWNMMVAVHFEQMGRKDLDQRPKIKGTFPERFK